MFETQKMKNQIRSTVDVDSNFLKTEDGQSKLQNFINRAYKAFKEKAVAIVPQQKRFDIPGTFETGDFRTKC
ncbi:hypothetical protein RWE15_23925 [Virgibacillus halophilus]|uniref:Uncharacterized protein n=1 Tax=Tigheibacillus halophilus TaxID=361280 RepID=A0ABU5CDY2_9BACI|nr:hypothetical protein [Virgibacillus halophilus]